MVPLRLANARRFFALLRMTQFCTFSVILRLAEGSENRPAVFLTSRLLNLRFTAKNVVKKIVHCAKNAKKYTKQRNRKKDITKIQYFLHKKLWFFENMHNKNETKFVFDSIFLFNCAKKRTFVQNVQLHLFYN